LHPSEGYPVGRAELHVRARSPILRGLTEASSPRDQFVGQPLEAVKAKWDIEGGSLSGSPSKVDLSSVESRTARAAQTRREQAGLSAIEDATSRTTSPGLGH
jgi:hypothetical protein